jgi:putative GTP pyrophosphokinase
MAVSPPWGSKGRLNRAGDAIRNHKPTSEDIMVLDVWRAAHTHVLNTFQAILRNRTKGKGIAVAQRLKRRSTIVDKLSREPGMQLARMDDVAGCRLIFPSIVALEKFRTDIHRARFNHKRKNDVDKYDYIKSPKTSGYRGIHDIYEYNTNSKTGRAYNGLLLELQYRTRSQHAWATAVEVISRLTENQPKFDRGDERYKEFFRLTSEIISRVNEKSTSCYPALSPRELLERYVNTDGEIGLYQMLRGLTVINRVVPDGGSTILQFKSDGDLVLHRAPKGKAPSDIYFELEKSNPDDDIVLVRADTFADIRSSYRNYFSDALEFLRYVREGCAALEKPGDQRGKGKIV